MSRLAILWTVAIPDHLVSQLGTRPDSDIAREAGCTRQAVAKARTKAGIPAFRDAVRAAVAKPPTAREHEPPQPLPEDRIEFLRETIEALQCGANPGLPGFAATHSLAAKLHAELLLELKARKPPASKRTPAQWKEIVQREAPNWPDQILELVVGVYLDRHGYDLTPKALRAV